MTAEDYKIGQQITFADQGNVQDIHDGFDVVVATGTVNGEAVTDPDTGVTYVPVWTERPPREGTTIYVNTNNILGGKA